MLCYDGSDAAKGAIEHAGAVLGGGPAIVLCVWESVGWAMLGHPIGERVEEITKDVVEELDGGIAERARAKATEGKDVAQGVGFDARELARRVVGGQGERWASTVWQEVLHTADEEDAAVVVLGSRGRSAVEAALLGSVSYGVVHNAALPVLIVPPPR